MSLKLKVPDELAGQRLDVVVARLAPQISRRQARRLVDDGGVFVDGKRVQVCSRALRSGAVIEVSVTAPHDRAAPPPRILALDADVVVVDKAAGVPTEPTREGSRGTLKAGLDEALSARGEDIRFLHAAHRLDTHATGVVIFARSSEAAHQVGRQLHEGSAERRYFALVTGAPTWTRARLDWSLHRTPGADGRIHVDEDGAPSLTLVTVLARGARASLALCVPRTGRTHQLRVHLAEAGHPLVGDKRYGGGRRTHHLGLHAFSVSLVHPAGKPVRYSAAPPPSFLEAAGDGGIPAHVVDEVSLFLLGGRA